MDSPDLVAPGGGMQPVSPDSVASREHRHSPVDRHSPIDRSRTSAALVGVCAGVVVLILMIVFIAQNTDNVRIAFFGFEGQLPLALALLIAGVAGAIIAMAVAGARILQLRKMVRRGRR
jgi:uncharacterized integral membrane protein